MLSLNHVRTGLALVLAALSAASSAQTPEYRASWADAFHPGYLSSSALTTTVNNLRGGNVNVFVPEIYVSSLVYWNPTASEYPDLGSAATIVSNGVPILCDLNSEPEYNAGGSYDPLGAAISQCHDTSGGKARVEVWGWMVSFMPSGAIQSAHPDWITVNADSSPQTDLDPGHPGAAQELFYKCMDIVKHYDVDGLNFDFVRFTNANNGYNRVSVSRYNAIKGKTGIPNTSDGAFKQWRRDQITNVIRKIYLNVIAIKPNVRLSVDAITWTPSPTRPTPGDPNPMQTWKSSFQANSGAYTGVYQDWRGWMEEGIIDIAMLMNYFRECVNKADYDKWSDFAKDNQFGRQCVIGPGGYLNAMPDGLAQMARTRDASSTMGKYGAGQNNYSYAVPYAATCGGAEKSDPAGWRDAIKAGIYSQPAPLPALPRLTSGKGHIKGTVVSSLVASPGWVDGGTVTLSANADGSAPLRTMPTDGTGFYGFVDVTPGSYYIKVHAKNNGDQIKPVNVTSATVATVDFTLGEPPPASQLAFSVQPAGATAGFALTTQPVVVAKDPLGYMSAGFNGQVTLAIKAGTGASGASLMGTATVNAVNGVATFSGLSIDRPGTGYVLTATSGSLTAAESSTFAVETPPAKLVFSQQPAGASAAAPFTTQPIVTATDDSDNIVPSFGGAITIQIKPGTGTSGAQLFGTVTRSAVNGVATFSGLSIGKPGSGYVLRATVTGLAAADSEAFAVAVVPTRLTFSTSPGGAIAAQPLAPQPIVVAKDDDGNAATAFAGPVMLSIKDGTGVPGAILNGTVTATPVAGAAAFNDLSIDKVGYGYRLHAVSGSLTAADSYAFDIRTAAVKLAFATQPGGALAGSSFTRQPVVVAQNAEGGTAADYEGPVNIGIKDGSGSVIGWLDGNTSMNMVKGIAAFTDLRIDAPAIGYVLTASSSPLPDIESAGFNVIEGGPYTLADAIRAMRILGGLVTATSTDVMRLDVDGVAGVDLIDAVSISRKLAGFDVNP